MRCDRTDSAADLAWSDEYGQTEGHPHLQRQRVFPLERSGLERVRRGSAQSEKIPCQCRRPGLRE